MYDGTDAIIVSCIANGMLTKEQVGEAVYTAADCNHDGAVNTFDVELLQQAGILLAGVDQSKSKEELQTSSAYIEYLNLIDQTVETESAGNGCDETSDHSCLNKLLVAIITLIEKFIEIIKSALAFVF